MADGKIEAYGGRDIITSELIERTYGIKCKVVDVDGMLMVVPEPKNKK